MDDLELIQKQKNMIDMLMKVLGHLLDSSEPLMHFIMTDSKGEKHIVAPMPKHMDVHVNLARSTYALVENETEDNK